MVAAAPSSDRRRVKAAAFVLACGCAGAAPHWLSASRSLLPGAALALLLGSYSLGTVLLPRSGRRGDRSSRLPASPAADLPATDPAAPAEPRASSLDLVVAARDEQEVIGRLVRRLLTLPCPGWRRRVWVVDDGSEDGTPRLLQSLQASCPDLHVLHRPRGAGGGKSGALNAVLPSLTGEWLLVLDADAQLQEDALVRLMKRACSGSWSAIQMRKAIANAEDNLLTRAQAMEMAFDAYVQEGRLASGGIAELRGNGQLLRRSSVLRCGGFNEATVTDDLDLSFRMLLAGEPIGLLWDPPVEEEAVRSLPALWRQRQRWAEGGLQRFLDYWPALFGAGQSLRTRADLLGFFLLQYALPVASASDLGTALLTRTWPVTWPLSVVALSVSGCAVAEGCRRSGEGPRLPAASPLNVLLAVVYLVHWFLVIPWVSLRMALLPKRLVWAKTLHQGPVSEPLEVPDTCCPADRSGT
jgi:1,2-diacylglycerol 3-beta-glucosyltransferase